MRSDTIKKGFEHAPHRSLLRATGVIQEESDFERPFIGVANSYIDLIPGHVHLQKFGMVAKQAIREAGGVPFEFNTIGVSENIIEASWEALRDSFNYRLFKIQNSKKEPSLIKA